MKVLSSKVVMVDLGRECMLCLGGGVLVNLVGKLMYVCSGRWWLVGVDSGY